MAQASALKTYEAIGDREDLTDVIATITLSETPLFSTLEKVQAKGVLHEWQTDSLSTGSSNAAIEGADFSFSIPGVRTRVHNHTQIFTKSLEVAETQRAVSVAGLDDEFAYQMEKRMKEIATDIEKALITGTGNSGASGTARELNGILNFISTNVETGTGTGTEVLTESMYNNLLQTIWAAGGRPDYTYVNGFQKRKLSAFASNSQRYQSVDAEGQLKNSVAGYESDFGVQRLILDPFMDTDKLMALQRDMWKIAVLRGIKQIDVAVNSDSKRGALVGELTLESRNCLASGKITGLTTS